MQAGLAVMVALLMPLAFSCDGRYPGDDRMPDVGNTYCYYYIWKYFVPDQLTPKSLGANSLAFSITGKEVFDLDHDPETFRQLALEHGDRGDSLMLIVPLPIEGLPCWMQSMNVISVSEAGDTVDVSSTFKLFYFTFRHESSIIYGPAVDIPVDSLTTEHLMWMAPKTLVVHTADDQPLADSLKYTLLIAVKDRKGLAIDIN